MKRKLTALMVASLCAMQSWAQQNPFTIIVKPTKEISKQAKIFVRYFVDNQLTIDSIVFDKGKPVYQGKISDPTMVNLYYSPEGITFLSKKRTTPWDRVDLYVEEGTTTVLFDGRMKESKISGGKVQKEFSYYYAAMKPFDTEMEALKTRRSQLYLKKEEGKNELETVMSELSRLEREKAKAKEAFIKANPNSYFSLLALKELAGSVVKPDYVKPFFDGLSAALKNSKEGIELSESITIAQRLAIGNKAPDFSQPDVNGKAVKLSDFKGKYVLLDFWASWCGPCRADNPNLVKAYEAYKDKNFTILGLSLDRQGKKDDWLTAIAKDGLPWTHVSDLTGWKNEVAGLYGIRAIPQNFLIDPTGKIIAKNLHGNQLTELLKKLL